MKNHKINNQQERLIKIGWIKGFVDGEGCFSISLVKQGNRKENEKIRKGYKIGYAEKAEVYVRNAMTWKDWVTQKTRTSKAHETLSKYVDISTTPRVKSFKNEFLQGISLMITYPNSFKEAFWTLELGLSRFYMWLRVFSDTKVKNKHYGDAWERIESTKSQTIKTISR